MMYIVFCINHKLLWYVFIVPYNDCFSLTNTHTTTGKQDAQYNDTHPVLDLLYITTYNLISIIADIHTKWNILE